MLLVKRLHIYLFFCTKMRIYCTIFCQKHAEFFRKDFSMFSDLYHVLFVSVAIKKYLFIRQSE